MNILTFDIEDWWVYEKYSWGKASDYLPRLERYLNEILDLLDEKDICATFFCLGEVARTNPEIVKKISDKGHQIGCHSFSHQFWKGDARPAEVEADTKKGLSVIENIIGKKVTAYRAPAFSITEKNKWIFGILAENGIKYDSSIFPASRSFGGFPSFKEQSPSIIKYNGVQIKEFPISLTKIVGKNIAFSGGGYFRLFPYFITKKIMQNKDYVVNYFHISDFDKERIKVFRSFHGESALSRYFKNHYGLKTSFKKFKNLLSDFSFISIEEADAKIEWDKKKNLLI